MPRPLSLINRPELPRPSDARLKLLFRPDGVTEAVVEGTTDDLMEVLARARLLAQTASPSGTTSPIAIHSVTAVNDSTAENLTSLHSFTLNEKDPATDCDDAHQTEDVLQKYLKDCTDLLKNAADTVAEKRTVVIRLLRYIASKGPCESGPEDWTSVPLGRIEPRHILAFVDHCRGTDYRNAQGQQRPLSKRTMSKHLTHLSGFFQVAIERGALDRNPVAAIDWTRKATARAAREEARTYPPFNWNQIATVFEPEPYFRAMREPEFFWLPLLSAYSGCRIAEVVTLPIHALDFHAETGIHYLRVGLVHWKTSNSRRIVPIADALIRLGFLDYVDRMRALGADRMFPTRRMTPTRRADPSTDVSERFGCYLANRSLKKDGLVFHSFRHTVITALAAHDVPAADAMQLVGHAKQESTLNRLFDETASVSAVHKLYDHSESTSAIRQHALVRLKHALDASLTYRLDISGLAAAAKVVTELVRVIELAPPPNMPSSPVIRRFSGGWHTNSANREQEALRRLSELRTAACEALARSREAPKGA